ncbi:Transcriptional regulator of nonfermentable carbon utilization [Coemansia erecta]|uniref:Transcriptional regulator of nonfermentable carbon utilization n=1 Tax=Coemansia erecta TaxID=147472 RepID=A0A9W8CT23_9FUNG|nr:Transcriptional regulator of nonfermentable carbon utilization [Coemansia erecta]
MSRHYQRTSIAYLSSSQPGRPGIDVADHSQTLPPTVHPQQPRQQQQQQQHEQHSVQTLRPISSLDALIPRPDLFRSTGLPPLPMTGSPLPIAPGDNARDTLASSSNDMGNDVVTDSVTDSVNDGGSNANNPKRPKRKTNRACNHCQKSHLTCDDSRPCARCVKRGIDSTCVDGVRKKAKYLLGIEDLETQKSTSDDDNDSSYRDQGDSQQAPGSATAEAVAMPDIGILHSGNPAEQPIGASAPASASAAAVAAEGATSTGLRVSPTVANFGSEAINLEYAFLSSMLSYPLFQTPGAPQDGAWHAQGHHQPLHPQSLVHHDQSLMPPAGATISGIANIAKPSPPPHAQIVTDDTHNPLSRPPTSGPAVYGLNPVYPQSPAQVYSSVTEPYKYYNGFHYFFRHICGRMNKKDIMRVSRAIAHFRPSLVALLRNLTYDDLIFMEKSFQRALMEYEKLIGFIGTPTVVWRRSGEIALVGKEFSILTQWDRQQLMAGNKFIFELMDTTSAVDYWEQFAVHAFENSEHSVMSECRLVRPDGVTVPCAFSFTIKRDLFGIPMAIIGNFLPIL